MQGTSRVGTGAVSHAPAQRQGEGEMHVCRLAGDIVEPEAAITCAPARARAWLGRPHATDELP